MIGDFLMPGSRRSAAQLFGLLLALLSVLAPLLPLGPLAQSPPAPLAVLWAAYGWAAQGASGWRAPTALFLFGLIHDVATAGPPGFFPVIYLTMFALGGFVANATRSPNLFTEWGGFFGACLLTAGVAALIGPIAFGGRFGVLPYLAAAGVTALLYPLVRPLYAERGGAS
jgi:hypothetical protein